MMTGMTGMTLFSNPKWASKICLYKGREIKGNSMSGDEAVSWLQFMLDRGCPKCKQKEEFTIKVDIPMGKDPSFISMYELINMKPGSYFILCGKCDYYTRDINELR